MAKKADQVYYDNFTNCADCGCRAAEMLADILKDFNPEELPKKLEEIHEIEHEGDELRHSMTAMLIKAFITPIEREDIMEISRNLDDITDTIEDVLMHIYMYDVRTIRPEALQFMDLISRSCKSVKNAMKEIDNFKKSKKLREYLIEINDLEEEGDRLYLRSMRILCTSDASPLEIVAWREILKYLERCLDACEDTADIIEAVIMKNS